MFEDFSSIGFAGAAALITFFATLAAGVLPLWSRIRTNHQLLRVLTRIAAGILVASAFVVAIPEGIEMTFTVDAASTDRIAESPVHDHADSRWGFSAGLALLFGFALMLLVESLGFGHAIHEEHHHEPGSHLHHPNDHGQANLGLARLVLLGIGAHALADGLAIGAALASGSQILTLSLLFAMIMHKVPAAFSLGAFSLHTQASTRQTLHAVVWFSLATPIAMLIAWQALAGLNTRWIGHALLFSAGTFLYVATVDVLPYIIADADRKRVALHVLAGALLLTLAVVAATSLDLVSHSH